MPCSASQVLDEYLVAASRTGDRKALGLLAERWHGKLLAHAWRLTGDAELARDAAQASWLEIIRGLGRLRDDRAFPAWAYRVVSRGCARQIGQAVGRRKLAAGLSGEPVEPPSEADQSPGTGCAPRLPSCPQSSAGQSRCSISRK